MAFFQPDRNANSHRARQIRCQRLPPPPENLQVLEKLHETTENTNVIQITEGNRGFAAFSIPTIGIKRRHKTPLLSRQRGRGRRATAGGKNTSMRLPDFSLRVKGLFVAVPQIEHNWTPHRPPPPQT